MVSLLAPLEGADAGVIAEALIAEFGSLPELFAASSARHRRVTQSDRTIELLSGVRAVMKRTVAARLECRPLLTTSSDLRDYLRMYLAYERVETVRVLYLDAARRLIADEQAGRGGPDEAPFYVRTILGRALELGATGILVAHNHPSGIMQPSEADLAVTEHLSQAASIVGVLLVDHLIVTRGGVVSIAPGAPARRQPVNVPHRPAAVLSDVDVRSCAGTSPTVERRCQR